MCNTIKASPPVRDVLKDIKIERREMYDSYTGTQKALIAAHLASEDMFPVWPMRLKYHLGRDITTEEYWRIERRRSARFELRCWHERRELPPKPLTPNEYKEHAVQCAEITLGALLEYVRGNTKGANGLKLSNSNDLERLVTTLWKDIRAARVIRKPRLAVVK